LTLLPMRTGGTFEEHKHEPARGRKHKHGHKHDHDHDDDHSGIDAHIWLDPHNAKAIVRHMATSLAAADPEKAALYRSNAEAVATRLDALGEDLKRDLVPLAGKSYVVFHDA